MLMKLSTHEEEEREQHGHERVALGADRVAGDAVADEEVAHLADVLDAARDDDGLAEGQHEEHTTTTSAAIQSMTIGLVMWNVRPAMSNSTMES